MPLPNWQNTQTKVQTVNLLNLFDMNFRIDMIDMPTNDITVNLEFR